MEIKAYANVSIDGTAMSSSSGWYIPDIDAFVYFGSQGHYWFMNEFLPSGKKVGNAKVDKQLAMARKALKSKYDAKEWIEYTDLYKLGWLRFGFFRGNGSISSGSNVDFGNLFELFLKARNFVRQSVTVEIKGKGHCTFNIGEDIDSDDFKKEFRSRAASIVNSSTMAGFVQLDTASLSYCSGWYFPRVDRGVIFEFRGHVQFMNEFIPGSKLTEDPVVDKYLSFARNNLKKLIDSGRKLDYGDFFRMGWIRFNIENGSCTITQFGPPDYDSVFKLFEKMQGIVRSLIEVELSGGEECTFSAHGEVNENSFRRSLKNHIPPSSDVDEMTASCLKTASVDDLISIDGAREHCELHKSPSGVQLVANMENSFIFSSSDRMTTTGAVMNQLESRIANIALSIIAGEGYEYRHDPEHKHKPDGGNWEQTDSGWSKRKEKGEKKPSPKAPVKEEKKAPAKSDIDKAVEKAVSKSTGKTDAFEAISDKKALEKFKAPEQQVKKHVEYNLKSIQKKTPEQLKEGLKEVLGIHKFDAPEDTALAMQVYESNMNALGNSKDDQEKKKIIKDYLDSSAHLLDKKLKKQPESKSPNMKGGNHPIHQIAQKNKWELLPNDAENQVNTMTLSLDRYENNPKALKSTLTNFYNKVSKYDDKTIYQKADALDKAGMNLKGEAGDLVGATAQKLFDHLLEKQKTAPKSKMPESINGEKTHEKAWNAALELAQGQKAWAEKAVKDKKWLDNASDMSKQMAEGYAKKPVEELAKDTYSYSKMRHDMGTKSANPRAYQNDIDRWKTMTETGKHPDAHTFQKKSDEPSEKDLDEATKKPMIKHDQPGHQKLKHYFSKSSRALDMAGKLGKDLGEATDDLLDEMTGFKVKEVGQKGYSRNKEQVKADFIKNMDSSNYDSPEAFKKAKDRIQKMSAQDFSFLLAEIMEDED